MVFLSECLFLLCIIFVGFISMFMLNVSLLDLQIWKTYIFLIHLIII